MFHATLALGGRDIINAVINISLIVLKAEVVTTGGVAESGLHSMLQFCHDMSVDSKRLFSNYPLAIALFAGLYYLYIGCRGALSKRLEILK